MCSDRDKIMAFVLAGIGLNVDNEKPTICLNGFLRELSIVDYQFKREEILAAFFNKFEQFYNLFVSEGKFFTALVSSPIMCFLSLICIYMVFFLLKLFVGYENLSNL